MNHPARKISSWIALTLLLAIGFHLRFQGAHLRAIDYDEIYLMRRSVLGLPLTDAPLAPLLLRYFLLLTDFSGEMVFLWSALLGTAAILLFYALARMFSGSSTVALGCASFLAFSPLSIFYAQKGRPYSLLLCVSAVLYLCFFRAWREPTPKRWGMFALSATAATCTHLVALQVLAALAGGAVAARVLWRHLGLTEQPSAQKVRLVVLISILASALGLADLHSEETNWHLVNFFAEYRAGLLPFLRSLAVGLSSAFEVVSGGPSLKDGIMVCFLSLALYGLLRLVRARRGDEALILASCILVPTFVMFLTLGCLNEQWSWLRYVSHLALPFGLLLVHGCNEAAKQALPKFMQKAATRALLLFAFPLAFLEVQPGLALHGRDGDGMVFKIAAGLPLVTGGLPFQGYVTFTDRPADLLWLFGRSELGAPRIFWASNTPGAAEIVRQQEVTLPPRAVRVPRYFRLPKRPLLPGAYAVVGNYDFPALWVLADCSALEMHAVSTLKARELPLSERRAKALQFEGKQLIRPCELYADTREPKESPEQEGPN